MAIFFEEDLSSNRFKKYVHKKRQKTGNKKNTEKPALADQKPESFLGAPCRTVTFRIPSPEKRQAMRTEFEQGVRAGFVKYLAETQRPALLAAGISAKQIEDMKRGFTPHGFNTHHKLPIYGGGTNDFSNLVLIRREPYHDMMHYHLISPQTRGMKEGDFKDVIIPDPTTPVYVPPSQYKFLEKLAKKGRKTYGKNKNLSFEDVYKEAQTRASLLATSAKKKAER